MYIVYLWPLFESLANVLITESLITFTATSRVINEICKVNKITLGIDSWSILMIVLQMWMIHFPSCLSCFILNYFKKSIRICTHAALGFALKSQSALQNKWSLPAFNLLIIFSFLGGENKENSCLWIALESMEWVNLYSITGVCCTVNLCSITGVG